MITAHGARSKYSEDVYAQNMIAVNEAILASCDDSHEATLDIPTGVREKGDCAAYLVTQSLREIGFRVVMIHDPENGSSELTIRW